MTKFIFSNIIGAFVFNESGNILDSVLFKDIEQYNDRKSFEEKLRQKHSAIAPDENALQNLLTSFKDKRYFSEFNARNIKATKKSIKDSVKTDLLILQTASCIEDIDQAINLLVKRLREWYSYYNPEASYAYENHEKFVASINHKKKSQLLKELNVNEKETMGADLREKDISEIMKLSQKVIILYELRHDYESYLEELEKEECPNFLEIAGVAIASRLIAHAGSMKRLAQMPASTIQILGAEKALFRHMRNKKRNLPPKYGIIHEHPLVQKVENKMQAKAARALADKMSIAIRVDYFKGKFIGNHLKKELVKKFMVQF